MMMRSYIPHRPALPANDNRMRNNFAIFIAHSLQQRPVDDAGGGKSQNSAFAQIVNVIYSPVVQAVFFQELMVFGF